MYGDFEIKNIHIKQLSEDNVCATTVLSWIKMSSVSLREALCDHK